MINDDLLGKEFEFEAKILNCRYYNPDSAWGVYRFSTNSKLPFLETEDRLWVEDNNGEGIGTLTGNMQELTVGCKYNIVANLQNSKFGWQYSPNNIFAIAPKSTDEQLMFLKLLVNETVANNIIEKYPNVINDVINGDLETINYSIVSGVGEKTWKKIRDKILENYTFSEIITMLKPLGVSFKTIKALVEWEKNTALLKQKIEKNPYILTNIDGFGFKRVDNFVVKFKPKLLNSKYRLIAFIKYFFYELGESDGHTLCSISELRNAVSDTIPECIEHFNDLLDSNNFLYIDKSNHIGLIHYYNTEKNIYNILNKKSKMSKIHNINEDIIASAIEEAENIQGFKYTKEQIEVINNVLNNNVSLITGKAGVGKSSIMRAILIALKKSKIEFDTCALSAMAAKRIEEASGFPSKTIHRTLGSKGDSKFEYNKFNKLPIGALIIDEGSMIGASLFNNLLEAVGDNTIVIISGDHKQLPPIGWGNIFSDLIDKLDECFVNKLTKPMRQAQESGILVDANVIRENVNPLEENYNSKVIHGNLKDMYYMFRNDRESLFKVAIKTYFSSIKNDGSDDVVIITPRKQGCNNSSSYINKTIQSILMGKKSDEERIIYGEDKLFYVGDKVIQTVNNYDEEVFNGDTGYVTKIYDIINDNKKERICEVTFKTALDDCGNPKVVEYKKSDLKDLDLAYALTCHKLQGAGIKTVIGIIDNTHYTLLDNCMLYTLLTRAKKRCLLLAEPTAFQTCIRKSHNNRNTWLSLNEEGDKNENSKSNEENW